jgi:ferredoxin
MAKNITIFWVDVGLFMLLAVTILTAPFDIFTHSFVHVFFGILLSAGALLHVSLHREWIKNAFERFGRLPNQARSNARLNLALFCAYSACGGMGLIARSMLIILPLHVCLGAIHVFLAVLVIILQIVHLTRHWKWMTATARRMTTQQRTLLRTQLHLPLPLPNHTMTKYIKLDNSRCQACWKCVESCSNDVLGKAILFKHRHAHVDYAEACKGCKKCIHSCPNNAISYTYVSPTRELYNEQDGYCNPRATFDLSPNGWPAPSGLVQQRG